MCPYGGLHRLGILRNALEHFFERRRQGSQPFQALLEIIKLLPVWQCTLQQQVGDLFKGGVLRQVIEVVTAAGQADSFLAHGADGRRACGLSAQPADGSRRQARWYESSKNDGIVHGDGRLYCQSAKIKPQQPDIGITLFLSQ